MTTDTWNGRMMTAANAHGTPDRGGRPAGLSTTDSAGNAPSARRAFSAPDLDHLDPAARIYELSGAFTDCRAAYEFLDRLRDELPTTHGTIVIDLEGVTQMTSCGVGILAAAWEAALDAGRPLVLTGMGRRLVRVMTATGLHDVIPSFATNAEALTAIKS